MFYYLTKIVISVFLIVLISEISKRFSFWGAVCASMPLVSVIAIVWLYLETGDAQKIIALSYAIFWLVIPSLAFFIILPALLRMKIIFPVAISLALAGTCLSYFFVLFVLRYFGVKL